MLFFIPNKLSSPPCQIVYGFINFCNSGQNKLRKFTIATKLLHPSTVVGGFNFCIASGLHLSGLMQTLLSFMKIVFPMYCKSVLNNWHFFRDILSQFFNKAVSKSSNFAICDCFEGVNNKRSSIIASQYL